MIDDLATRFALTLAAFVVLGAGLSVISLSGDAAQRQTVRELATFLSRELDAIGRLGGPVEVRFGADEHAAVRLPSLVGGRSYRLEIRTSDVRILGEATIAVESLLSRVHPFAPAREEYASEELRDLDRMTALIVPSGEPFLVVRAEITLEGIRVLLTFAYAL